MTVGDPNRIKSGASRPDQGTTGAASRAQSRSADKPAAQKYNMDFILDIPLEISVELGRTTLMINDLLKLGQGSVVELSKVAGETLEVLANQRLIARGEVVVVNEKYGIRLTEIISPMERIERLR
jgi:flagellar motor switch protein FliN/FliY